ncbi:hypothetical protein LTR10_019330 [Elasticomyces elasticus]|uniref:LysM domain-containing protein n=1 Tax=Exophiala sideris TaxID=1016849 RepID=A0ABR0J113_9EURO|nr:hypothetical protein LTR10_019330 [Elasticomyces elasticus]KAK5024331.1 hypothetical protein LTS07_008622 [Exophiala sideris]KAK5030987.1 hypothetical protein LTR13_008000 [Exophiala sideris]KAK5054064.1 hypothetical protein LTR69_009026 [Exophiala sideris]KAK5179580.1 hypothetical protein LTR44_008096 [Eurotiomycetes sp. CCFEE 6388]
MHIIPTTVLTATFFAGSAFAGLLPTPIDRRATCDTTKLNTTAGTYNITEGDTIFSVATATGRGVCDIARYNRLAVASLIYPGEQLAIPPQVCDPDNDTCLLVNTMPTRDCILGGPHVYTTVGNETIEYIALYKLNITVDALFNGSSRMLPDGANASTILEVGQALKVPQCYPSVCEVEPYTMQLEVYKDMAAKFGTTVGQIMGFNPSYNHSAGGGPTLTIPMNCRLLGDNYTIIS